MEEENKTTQEIPQEDKGLSITAMVLGIISIVLLFSLYISVPCAVLAIILGVIANKKNNKNKFAKSGLILGIISMVFSVIFIIYIVYITVYIKNGLYDAAEKAVQDTQTQLEQSVETERQLLQYYN